MEFEDYTINCINSDIDEINRKIKELEDEKKHLLKSINNRLNKIIDYRRMIDKLWEEINNEQ